MEVGEKLVGEEKWRKSFFFFLVREGKEVYRFWGGNRGNETLVMGFRYLKSIFYIW